MRAIFQSFPRIADFADESCDYFGEPWLLYTVNADGPSNAAMLVNKSDKNNGNITAGCITE